MRLQLASNVENEKNIVTACNPQFYQTNLCKHIRTNEYVGLLITLTSHCYRLLKAFIL